MTSGIQDFEDAIQTCAAEFNEIEVIITRNKKDFTNTSLKILTPREFLKFWERITISGVRMLCNTRKEFGDRLDWRESKDV